MENELWEVRYVVSKKSGINMNLSNSLELIGSTSSPCWDDAFDICQKGSVAIYP